MHTECQWLHQEDNTVCGYKGVREVKIPLTMGATAVVVLCLKHNAMYNQINAGLRDLRKLARR